MNKTLLKTITVLYFGDDISISQEFKTTLDMIFKKIYFPKDYSEVLELYKKKKIDIIINDSNADKLNDIEVLREIRLGDKNIPIIFITVNNKNDFLLSDTEYGVTQYMFKPFSLMELIERINTIIERKILRLEEEKENEELSFYVHAINEVALISKHTLDGRIICVNDMFCKTSSYSRKELVGNNLDILKHPETAKEVFINIWITIRSGKVWRGKIKNIDKNKKTYSLNASIIPRYDKTGKNLKEYLTISFLTTEEDLKKRKFQKNVLTNIQESKRIKQEDKKKIEKLEDKMKAYEHYKSYIVNVQDRLSIKKHKIKKYKEQLTYYEDKIKNLDTHKERLILNANNKINDSSIKIKELTIEKKTLNLSLKDSTNNNKNINRELKEAINRIEEQNKIIINLRDVIDFREEELRNFKKSK